jgi:hypothetical protein
MDIEKYEKATSLRMAIGDLESIIREHQNPPNPINLNEELYPPYFLYSPRGAYASVLTIRIPDIVYDDIIEVIKRRRDELQKEFDEL